MSTDNLVNAGIQEGDDIFFKILKDYPEINDDDPRRLCILSRIMTNCIVQLHLNGYTEQELVNEVFDWCEIARNLLNEEEDDEE